MDDKSQVEYVLSDIRAMINNIIIKINTKAEQYETADIRRDADKYIAAYMEKDTFNSHRIYPIDVLVNAGITDINDIMAYNQDRQKIPRNKRKEVLKYMRQAIINEYEERNDYYRELIGKPSMNTPESEFIYLTQEEMDYFNIDEVRPIHDYPKEIQIKLERSVIPALIKQYPEKTYLQHMGSKSVNLVRARQARNFEIIFTDIVLDYVFMRAFFETYDFCREYFMSLIYNKQFKVRYNLYDNYIGMHIMIMTIQRLIVDTIKMGIDRDFYDLISIQKLFNVYGVPFFDELPLDYQRTIVKNINMLIRTKSTDKVLYDVANTLFYERVQIYKYFLVKERKFDENGEPVFLYKTVATEEDSEKTYLRSDNGKVYQLLVTGDRLQTSVYNNEDEVNVEDFVFIRDENTQIKYKILMRNDKLSVERTSEDGDSRIIYAYNEQNKRYRIYINDTELCTIEHPYDHIDDFSRVDTVKVFIKSSNNLNYELIMVDGHLTTIESDNHTVHAPSSLYIKDEINNQKFRLFMIDDILYAEETNDDVVASQTIFLYDDDLNRYKLTINKNKLQSSQYYYNVIEVYDYENMFDVYFQAVDIMEKNSSTVIENKYNRYDYEEITNEDIYWWETEELKKELYERDYNFIDTKYIGITVMQNLTNLLYETSYFLNLLVDHKDTTTPIYSRLLNSDAMKTGTDYLYVVLDRISSVPISIFDTVIVLCALVSKKNGMKGNIITSTPSKVLSVLGFNFELNFDLIRENIQKYKRVFKNQEIIRYLDLLDIKTVDDIDTLYNNFRNFAEFCEDVLANTTDINEYKAYKELYKVFTVREEVGDMFTKSDGTVALTYLDYLYDKLPVIAEFIDNLHKDKMGVYIEHAIGKLNELVPKIEYLNSMNGTNNNIIDAIISLINFFKSYTVDLRNLNVMYMFDNKRLNKIYMIDDPRFFINLFPVEKANIYNDELIPCISFDKYDNLIILNKDGYELDKSFIPKEKFNTEDNLTLSVNRMEMNDTLELNYKDVISVQTGFRKDDVIKIRTMRTLSNEILHKDGFEVESFMEVYNLLNLLDNINLEYKDLIRELVVNYECRLDLVLKTLESYSIDIYKNINFNTTYLYELITDIYNEDVINQIDIMSEDDNMLSKNKLNVVESIKLIHED